MGCLTPHMAFIRQVAAGTLGSRVGSDGGLGIHRQESLAEVEPTWASSLGSFGLICWMCINTMCAHVNLER